VVWYDKAQDAGIYHQDWRLEDNPIALASFQLQAVQLRLAPGR
jgi:hypothetical protein